MSLEDIGAWVAVAVAFLFVLLFVIGLVLWVFDMARLLWP